MRRTDSEAEISVRSRRDAKRPALIIYLTHVVFFSAIAFCGAVLPAFFLSIFLNRFTSSRRLVTFQLHGAATV